MKFLEVVIEAWKKPVPVNQWEEVDERPITEVNTDDLVAFLYGGAVNPNDIQFLMQGTRDNRTFITMKGEANPITVVGSLEEVLANLEAI